jgi:hypothetical protein
MTAILETNPRIRDRQIADLINDLARARRAIDEDSRTAGHVIDMAIDFLCDLRLALHRDGAAP